MVPARQPAPSGPALSELVLIVLLGVVLTADLGVAVGSPAGETHQLLRLGLGVLAVCTLAVGLVCGVYYSTGYALGAVLGTPLVFVYIFTGLVLPWTQLSFTLGQLVLESALSVPVVGSQLAYSLFGGFTLTQATLERAVGYHYAVVAVGWLVFAGLVWTHRRGLIGPAFE